MGGRDHLLFNQCAESPNRACEPSLDGESSPPVLLPFPTRMNKPSMG